MKLKLSTAKPRVKYSFFNYNLSDVGVDIWYIKNAKFPKLIQANVLNMQLSNFQQIKEMVRFGN